MRMKQPTDWRRLVMPAHRPQGKYANATDCQNVGGNAFSEDAGSQVCDASRHEPQTDTSPAKLQHSEDGAT